jgi:hypothetical protein
VRDNTPYLLKPYFRQMRSILLLLLAVGNIVPSLMSAQAVPYAHTFAKSKDEVEKALKDLEANTGQKLPIVDGFVASTGQPFDRYERAFYQLSIEVVPGSSAGETIVRVSAKVTAWYNSPDPSQSGYQVLPSNGRLESDLLDRLAEKLGDKSAPSALMPEAPKPRIDLSNSAPVVSLRPSFSPPPANIAASAPGAEDPAALAANRASEEKHVQQLTAELQSLQEIQRNQAHPNNLVVVKKSGTPVLARSAEGGKPLFNAAADDEFEFIDAEGPWVHVQITGASRGYIRRAALDLPESIAARLDSQPAARGEEKQLAFRIEREDSSPFPGDWQLLKGKSVKIYTVQPASDDAKETGASAKLRFAASLIQKFAADSSAAVPPLEGVAVIFDSADGGILACTLADARKIAAGAPSHDALMKSCYMDPAEAFHAPQK